MGNQTGRHVAGSRSEPISEDKGSQSCALNEQILRDPDSQECSRTEPNSNNFWSLLSRKIYVADTLAVSTMQAT